MEEVLNKYIKLYVRNKVVLIFLRENQKKMLKSIGNGFVKTKDYKYIGGY